MGKINTVAIIGGGVSGLSAGGLLSRKGLRVKLFEANDKLGGSCANTEIDGYTFHDGALYLAFPELLEHVFEKENIGEHDGRRSLSVSDVVAINGEPWSVESIGWAKVDKADLAKAGVRYQRVR